MAKIVGKFRMKCEPCGGTGVYRDPEWKPGRGVLCRECRGEGWRYEGEIFTERLTRDDVTEVTFFFPWAGRSNPATLTYEEFLEGKRPDSHPDHMD
jgi:hypothetical protein